MSIDPHLGVHFHFLANLDSPPKTDRQRGASAALNS